MSTILEASDIKLEAHKIAVNKLEKDLKELLELIDNKRNEDDGITQGQVDRDALSHNTEDQDNILIMQQKVLSLNAQLALLNKYKHAKATAIVDPGSLVFVEDQAFYVSTSVESFSYNGQKVTCISIETPIYKAMKGLAAGTEFVCNGKNYKITKIS